MKRFDFEIKFKGVTAARGNILAAELKNVLKDAHQDVEAEQIREDLETMDLGAILAIILGSAAVTAVARGIKAWLERNQDVEIELQKDGHVIAKGLRGKDALALTKMILEARKSKSI